MIFSILVEFSLFLKNFHHSKHSQTLNETNCFCIQYLDGLCLPNSLYESCISIIFYKYPITLQNVNTFNEVKKKRWKFYLNLVFYVHWILKFTFDNKTYLIICQLSILTYLTFIQLSSCKLLAAMKNSRY